MNAGGLVTGIVFLLVGVVVAILGVAVYASCTAVGGATTSGPAGSHTSYPSGCGATLVVVVFGIAFVLVGLLAAIRSVRTTNFVRPPWNAAVPPPIFGSAGAPLPSTPILPRIRCPYCGTLVAPGPQHCPSCGAVL
ncbi:MAG: zinc ribbon domain-containing protein [Thermoplasmata archaeon]|nr:zinc ribbon domain-containing protein [Thermoplasmata archaeon]